VEATLHGTGDRKHLWVTAHLDSVYTAGANDDASGLVSILMTAKALMQIHPEHTVHFVAYDLEEVGLVGSSHYVRSTVRSILEQEGDGAIIGDLQSDMIGYEEGAFDAAIGTCEQALSTTLYGEPRRCSTCRSSCARCAWAVPTTSISGMPAFPQSC
jgi:hypothetical protein